jgi:hypothetical protein
VSRKAKLNGQFAKKNRIEGDIINRGLKKFKKEKNKLSLYRRRLQPFLLEEENADKIDFFGRLVLAI